MCRHEVLQLIGPCEGTCAVGCSVTLNLLFSPIVSGDMKAKLPIMVTASALHASIETTHTLTVHGHGYHLKENARPPRRRSSPALDPWQTDSWKCRICDTPLLSLSASYLNFGVLVQRGIARCLVVLTATSTCAAKFSWDRGEFEESGAIEGTLEIEPDHGELNPGESVLCQLSFTAGSEAQWVSGAIAVNAEPLTEDNSTKLSLGVRVVQM
jgi:hypothetical protein